MTSQTAALILLGGATVLTAWCLLSQRYATTESRLACWGALALCGLALAMATASFLR